MTNDTKFEVAPDVYARAFDDELVILDLASGHYFGLNDVGTDFWLRAAEGRSFGEAVSYLSERYEVEVDRLAADIEALASQLVARNLLREKCT